MDRTIPHIRNIFNSSSPGRKKSTSDSQDLCHYDRSPRSRHKSNTHQSVDVFQDTTKRRGDAGKENVKSDDVRLEERRGPGRNPNYNTYSSKTLTERDIRHLERHLSMKKTIRKQISRNLAQAFLDNPNLFEPEVVKDEPETRSGGGSKIAEQNVLDLLKVSIEDRDSGHSSPTPEHQDNTDCDDEEDESRGWRSSSRPKRDNAKDLVKDRPKMASQESTPEKKSIWKMFSSRNKTKR